MSDRIAIVGAGSIGGAWAVVFARAGLPVSVYDIDPARIAAAPGEIRGCIETLRDHQLVPALDEIAERVSYGTDLATAVGEATYVQECVLESVDVKRQVFAELDAATGASTVLASSTSMIAASRFAADLPGRSRCLVVHPGNPPYLLPVAEVVPAPFTSPETVTRTHDLLHRVGMTPIAVRAEVEGFVFNRLQGALLREAYCLVRDGVVSALDIDQIVRLGLGRRWGVIGPFATSDLNTRGGIERHATLMGPAYARMGAERGQNDPWTPELVASVADELHAVQPLDQWDENVLRRDEKLIRQVVAAADPAAWTRTGAR